MHYINEKNNINTREKHVTCKHKHCINGNDYLSGISESQTANMRGSV